jgi:hypothetical protein
MSSNFSYKLSIGSNSLNAVNFSITQSNTICIVYVIDSYRPVAGEITLAVTGFKGELDSLLSCIKKSF